MKIKTLARLFVLFSLLFTGASASAWYRHEGNIKVMTQNQYPGADLAPLLAATTPDEFNTALVAVLEKIAASRFIDRVERQAALIAKERPHIVALQEAWRFDCLDLAPSLPGKGCSDPAIAGAFLDQLEKTLDALKAKGVKYKTIARVKDLDVSVIQVPGLPAGIPFTINNFPALLNTIDRDVILARNDVLADAVDFSKVCPDRVSLEGCNYQVVAKPIIPGGPADGLPIERGFVAADARIGGKHYRIVNTHLELREPEPGNPITGFFQAAQAAELIDTLQVTTPPNKSLLLLGDMNSSPDDVGISGPLPLPAPFDNGIVPPYQQLVSAGYTDGWLLREHQSPGFTCCQDENLRNKKSALSERIDMIFSLQQPAWVEDIRVVGNKQKDKTLSPPPRLWPSDHGGVAAELQFWK
jgi:hypothetical protein